MGYGIAVDGVLLDHQMSTKVNSEPATMPSITAVFGLDAGMNENPIRIDVDENDSHHQMLK